MSQMHPAMNVPPKQGMSTGAKVGIGCAVVGVILIALCAGGAWLAYSQTLGQFTKRGYSLEMGDAFIIDQPMTGSVVYFGQSVMVQAPVDGSIALFGESLIIEDDVTGDVDFMGETMIVRTGVTIGGNIEFFGDTLRIEPGATVAGNLTGTGETLDNQGTVHGTVSGDWKDRLPGASPATPTDATNDTNSVDDVDDADPGVDLDGAADVDDGEVGNEGVISPE